MEQHIVITFLGENVLSAEIHHRLQQQYGEECLSRTCVFQWPRTSVTKPNTDRADALIRENRRITIKELGAMLSMSVGSVEDIVKNKMVHMQAASCLLQQFEDEGDAFLNLCRRLHIFNTEWKNNCK
jgi:plasmid maintenance system antidote protein VapI